MGRQAAVADRLNATSSDLLFEVGLRETGEPEPCSVQVMLDHQSSLDELFAWRAHVYAGELWGRHIDAQPRRPRRIPFILPVVLLQHPARNTPIRLSDILQLPARVRPIFGAPFEVELYIDDLATPILHDPEADAGHLALVEITRALLHAHKNQTPQTEQRLAQLGPLFDTVLVQFGSSNIKERLSYVVNVFGTSSAIYDTLMGVISQGVREMHRTVADDLRAEGRVEGRVAARAEALFGMLSHRAWSVPGGAARADPRHFGRASPPAMVRPSLHCTLDRRGVPAARRMNTGSGSIGRPSRCVGPVRWAGALGRCVGPVRWAGALGYPLTGATCPSGCSSPARARSP